ncbi:MAG: dTDP-glucose 4,6-dehydratase, partial [Myxococcales bacterium]
MTQAVLVTGGAGFIGSNLVRLLRRERPAWTVVNLDKLTYAGNAESLADLRGDPGHVFVRGDIADPEVVERVVREHRVDVILNLAAESHVDRSILGPGIFVETNVGGAQVLLEAARNARVKRFVQVSTDEVYGSLGASGKFTETSPLRPSSPYSASKAAADLLALAYAHTFGMDVVVTRCSNNYGPYQFPEKLIPLMIANALEGSKLPVYGDGMQVRDWIHVEDYCRALLLALEVGKSGEIYNIGSDNEWPNLQIVRRLLQILGKGSELIEHVKDRPGHDRRYAIDAAKAHSGLGWAPRIGFAEGLKSTVDWYVANRGWWERVR